MGRIATALTGLGIGLLIAAVQAYVNRGDVPWWEWVLVPIIVCVLFLWLAGHLGGSPEENK
jgi:peptidoglycan/LPS O-acetylase OafA/YrhL